jgi:pimeloyl-ACP methyl ester carboxylesterase
MKILKWILISLLTVTIIYLSGPKPSTPKYNKDIPAIPDDVENYINKKESLHHLKKNNEARIVWANDSLKSMTEYAIVYLHGFSASQEEGNPVHRNVAKYFNCNLYLSRLAEHGIDTTDQLINLTTDNYWESAKEALFIGKKLGKKVILMGTSTGGTQALQLAAAYPNDVAAIILYSPNIEINDPNAYLLNNPWGLQIARLVKGGKLNYPADTRPIYSAYWNRPYRLEDVVNLEEMIETSVTKETLNAVKQPVLMLYYFKDKLHQDNVVRVDAMKKMFGALSTPSNMKEEMAIPNAGHHVLGSPILSKDIMTVEKETIHFIKDKMGLKNNNP